MKPNIKWLKTGIERLTRKNKDNLPRIIKALKECNKILEIEQEAKEKYNKKIEELDINQATTILKDAIETIQKEEQESEN